MPPGVIKTQLRKLGETLRRWQAATQAQFCVAALMVWLFLSGLADLMMRMNPAARLTVWGILLALAAASAWWVRRIRERQFSIQGVAARVEHVFPQLDNRLINFLQFSDIAGSDPFKLAYLQAGVPGWTELDWSAMRDRRAQTRGRIALAAACLLLLAPSVLLGNAWTVAVWRVINPFTQTAPVSLTRILSVEPGNHTLRQGHPLVLSSRIDGRGGHPVQLDIRQTDGASTTYALGVLSGRGETEVFAHRMPRVATDLEYRFRAGDAPSAGWYQVTVRPPLALTSVTVTETPPAYTARRVRSWNALEEALEFHENAHIDLRLEANAPLTAGVIRLSDGTTAALGPTTTPNAWTGSVRLGVSPPLQLSVIDEDGESISVDLAYTLLRDQPPVIRILAPRGPVTLPPDAVPAIDFEVSDDYGLRHVAVERVLPGSAPDAPGEEIQAWSPENRREFAARWKGTSPEESRDGPRAFRIVAVDNRDGDPRIVRSDPVIFNPHAADDQAADERATREQAVFGTIGRLIELQRENVHATRSARDAMDATGADTWTAIAERQRQIRLMSKTLLDTPGEPLGSLTPTVRRLYVNEMAEAITLLRRIADAPVAERPAPSARALLLQEKILRQLSYAEVAAGQTSVERRIGEIESMLRAIIQSQRAIIEQTENFRRTEARIGDVLVDRQDDLASDTAAFAQTCRRESAALRSHDQAFADLLNHLAEQVEARAIREDMLLAAEQLERQQPAEALTHAQRALRELMELQALLESVAVARREEKHSAMREALSDARTRLERIREIHEKALESMDALREQGDASSTDFDLMEEEYQELLRTTRNALMEIPVDLHIFTELNVANDLVEDVFSVYEEIVQQEGSENLGADDVEFQPFSKEDLIEMLEAMAETEGFLDDLEIWLPDKPDDQQITFEAFDEEEMPESGIGLGDLAAQAEDLISDLLDEPDDLLDEAQDGATNLGMSEWAPGDAVLEGETTTFDASGKSGNVRPDHMEQDGRSNIGREGMSSGEAAAGSGTIQEGDENIEARRTQDATQDGQVDADGEAGTEATGGGKLGTGKADEFGMEGGGGRRMDATEAGSQEGMEALLARRAESLYMQASLQNIRSHALEEAAHHLRQAADAVSQGHPIEQVRELRQQAAASLRRATTELNAGAGAALYGDAIPDLLDGVMTGGPEEAPVEYRSLVAEYYKILNESL